MQSNNAANHIVDHLFRHEAGKMIAVLTRIFGTGNLQLAEDVVQEAFLKAIQTWSFNQLPDNPAAWLMQVAKNKAIEIIRRQQHFNRYSAEMAQRLNDETEQAIEQFFHDDEIADSQLRMMFACCHPSLKEEDQIALTLKTVSAFGITEIAKALLTQESAIQKRLYRAKEFLKNNHIELEIPAGHGLTGRLATVHTVLYLLFNEGYCSVKADEFIRKDLCAEAMRLCLLLSKHKSGNTPATFALLSLMCLQASRLDSRLDENNSIILLQHQDRSKWNKELVALGYQYLNQSSEGDHITIYHIESAIAAEHCLATDFNATNWQRMLALYDLLMQHKKTPVVQLNRAVVLSQMGQLVQALEEIWSIEEIDNLLATQHIYSAVLGDLYSRLGDERNAARYLQQSLQLTNSLAEQHLIADKIKSLQQSHLN